ncbi:enoyl-CoA hydratase/isomerase family protein [Prauserella cavernicola]|uniref:Enoyl-CoA hydratase/isomerase family protein n=1 Tax=Prauserella cavernicola TaxID=2800127 RepID=A0A934QWH2_9PSEU|nr:enoyl-CoA hydratase/isomerase family protein [Prauserella cavernicola]MBK1787806.1 enoyl-CoA hydratase/isomerase family protein [Prauserella cavernicola]
MSELRVNRSGRALTLILDRPAKRNALSAPLVEQLIDAVEGAYAEPTDLVEFRGEGRTFSAGFDFGGLAETTDGELLHRFVRIEHLLQLVHHAPFETAAFVHGKVFGAAADLLCACSHRIAAPGSAFRLPGLAFGIVLGTRRLAERVGSSAARWIQGEGAVLDAETALRLGLLTELADPSDWDGRRDALAERSGRLTTQARASFHRALTADTADADLAELVRSASVPGLRQRIQRFREEKAA